MMPLLLSSVALATAPRPELLSPESLPPEIPAFMASHGAIPEEIRARMIGVTWREGCPVGLDDLALVELSHWDGAGAVQQGQLIVAASQAEAIVSVFSTLYALRFPIFSMRPAHEFGGSDDASMAANNTSAFNCRAVSGGASFSEHSYGHAIDLNTIHNPYVRGSRVLPPEGAAYQDRTDVRPGMIVGDGPVVEAFAGIGWSWGGSWRSLKDYQHFSLTGR